VNDSLETWQQSAKIMAGEDYAHTYAARFDQIAAEGGNIHGEVDFLVARIPPNARVLDAGCGTGRISARLADLGFVAEGVDVDATMVAVARERRPDITWVVVDLADYRAATGFDAIVAAGNVIPFVADLERALASLTKMLTPTGLLITGFGLDRDHLPVGAPLVALESYDDAATNAGLALVERFGGWAEEATGSGYAVSVHRRR
jgi:2-polyprenyl-3-methyl-5-hydroxy-6-metoxy-1,4-benzoquinol methylase